MVTFNEARDASLNSAEDIQRRNSLLEKLQEADLRVASLGVNGMLGNGSDAVAARDYRQWRAKIVAAINRKRHEVNNFPWLWWSRGDDAYIWALQEILGPLGSPFTVGQDQTIFGNVYTRVIW